MPATAQDAAEWTSQLVTPGNYDSRRTVQAYAAQTELPDGRQAVLVDIGSWGNLGGSVWARRSAALAMKMGKEVQQTKRTKPLTVQGVGNGTQECTFDIEVPIALEREDGTILEGTYTMPTVNDSDLPALLGLKTLIDRRSILDFTSSPPRLVFTGPGETTIALAPGSESFPLEHAPSGHLMLPCCNYHKAAMQASRAKKDALSVDDRPKVTLQVSTSASSSSSSTP